MGYSSNQRIPREELQMAERHLTNYSTFLATMGMEIKSDML